MIEVTFINAKEALKILGVSYVTLARLVKEGKIKKYKAEGLPPRYKDVEVKELWEKLYK